MSDTETILIERSIVARGGCWEWTGGVSSYGYGRMWVNNRDDYAHRVAYRSWRGPIPSRHVVHHKCKNLLCVNPWHLKAMLQGDHMRGHLTKTHCLRGHDYAVHGVKCKNQRGRRCLACAAEAGRLRDWSSIGKRKRQKARMLHESR